MKDGDNFRYLGPITHYTLEEAGPWISLHYDARDMGLTEAYALKFVDGSIWDCVHGFRRCN